MSRLPRLSSRAFVAPALVATLFASHSAPQGVVPFCGNPSGDALAGRLLRSLAYGSTPAELDLITTNGPVPWVLSQLNPAGIPSNPQLDAVLAGIHLPTGQGDDGTTVQGLANWMVAHGLFSEAQLESRLTAFWRNHFTTFFYDVAGKVGGNESTAAWLEYLQLADFKAGSLGNYNDLVIASATNPSMLYYLDNRYNSVEGPNENYARELIELHCMGADAYLGSIPQGSVPLDGQGKPVGYVDEDVTAAARCLTGWTVRDRPWDDDFGDTGEFYYHAPDHDNDAKTVLGANLPANQAALEDGEDLLDLLATHPATARFVATKLCRRLIGDTPLPAVIDAAAATFLAHTAAPDQIARVVRTIVLAPEFLATWGDKIKRPFEQVASAMRACDANWTFRLDDDDSNTLGYRYYHTGQPLFQWHPPNGYPDFKGAWKTTSPMILSWKVTNWLVDVTDDSDQFRLGILAQTPPEVRSAEALTDFWTDRIIGYPIDPRERQEIIEFMAQGFNPVFDLPVDSDEQIQDRVRAMVGLIFMSPAFLWR